MSVNIHIADKTYSGGQQVIADLRLDLADCEFVALLGASGCGKTTLLNILSGVDSDFRGAISQNGQPLTDKIGYVFQQPRLLPWLTVRQNIAIVANNPYAADIDELLHDTQLDDCANAYPERLSLGQERRVAIARALSSQPQILLLDEPLVSLDAATARQVQALFCKLWRRHQYTILLVTHDLRAAITLADRLLFVGAAPMQLSADITVDIARQDRDDERRIEEFRGQILRDYPQINCSQPP